MSSIESTVWQLYYNFCWWDSLFLGFLKHILYGTQTQMHGYRAASLSGCHQQHQPANHSKESAGASVFPLLPWWSAVIIGEASHLQSILTLKALCCYAWLRHIVVTPLTRGLVAECYTSDSFWATNKSGEIPAVWLLQLDQSDGNSIQFKWKTSSICEEKHVLCGSFVLSPWTNRTLSNNTD